MTEAELRAKAERVVDAWEGVEALMGPSRFEGPMDAAATCCRRLLELLPPADNETRITRGWFDALDGRGFDVMADGGVYFGPVEFDWEDHADGVEFLEPRCQWGCKPLETRGDVRRLCNGLGLELKEPS